MAKSQKFSFIPSSAEAGHTMTFGPTSAGMTVTKVFKPNAAASANDYSGLKLTDAEFARIAGRKRGGR